MANHYDFTNRIALVTGGASGIGAAVTERLHVGGAEVHIFAQGARTSFQHPDLPHLSLDERLPAPVEAAAYYIASEALTNVAKHAQANVVELTAARDNGVLTLEVRDDGIGGLDPGRGSGILGLTDRAEALGGTISIASPPRGGTTLTVRLPTST